MIISKTFRFEAAHMLYDGEKSLEENEKTYGKCTLMHGHSYKLLIYLKSDEMKDGMVLNFSELKQVVNKHIIDKYDHQILNNHLNIPPTAENLAITIYNTLKPLLNTLFKVRVYETEGAYAEYEGQ